MPEPTGLLALSFTERHRLRPVELIDPGTLAVEETAPPSHHLTLAATGPAAPYATVQLELTEHTGTAAVGLATGDGDEVLVRVTRRSLVIEVRQQGRVRVLRRRRFRPPASYAVAFVLCESRVTALVDTGDGWRPVLSERERVLRLVDLRREDVLRHHRYAWQATGVGQARVRAGLFGGVGLRDPHLVQHADGTPCQEDGRQFMTWTSAGLGFFAQAHWSVWSFDPADPRDLRPESHLFFRRDGLVLGDHAGQLLRDGEHWVVAVSSWGDFPEGPIHVRHTTTTDDLLRGVHVLETEPTPLPTPHGTWDPAMLRSGDTWWVAFVESASQDPFDFHPALATTDADDWATGLSSVFAASGYRQCEGPHLVEDEGEVRLLVSDKDSAGYPVLDTRGRVVGRLDAPYPTNIPHPQVVSDPRGGWWIVTFDGTSVGERVVGYGGHGDVVLMHS